MLPELIIFVGSEFSIVIVGLMMKLAIRLEMFDWWKNLINKKQQNNIFYRRILPGYLYSGHFTGVFYRSILLWYIY